LQDLAYPAQLSLKATQLRTLLGATGLPLPELQLHSGPPLGYRNRIRLTLAEVDGQLRAGYLTATGPNQQPSFLPITQCPIAAPVLWRATEALLALIHDSFAPWMRNPQFRLDQLELFTNADESALLFTLYLRTAAKHLPKLAANFNTLCDELHVSIPALTGAGIAILPPVSPHRSRRAESAHRGPDWGAPGLLYAVTLAAPQNQNLTPDLSYWVPRGAFFQINRFLLPELLSLVTANRKGNLAWDLYAGVGLFSRALAAHFSRVTAVEIAEPAFTALASARLPNRHAVKETTLDFLRSAVIQRDRPDLVVLDPPRTGAGAEICALLGRIAAPTLIYVSCSPETLPADLQTLAAGGYTVAALHLLDLFPQTTHIETVAVLARTPRAAAQ
jgi:23S rRNA (uracil1939-C5)-methyltransferase